MIVQLPFPSTADGDPQLTQYYYDYAELFRTLVPEYFLSQGNLWELPLWVAHLTALLDSVGLDSTFCDLSHAEATARLCSDAVCADSRPGDYILVSPLAQNFSLAMEFSTLLQAKGRNVVVGGNMSPLVPEGAVHLVHSGQLDSNFAQLFRDRLTFGGRTDRPAAAGVSPDLITWVPNYRHLSGYQGTLPLLRLNASHGCLYNCSFCGDAWSRQLVIVDKKALGEELALLRKHYPGTNLLYIGDKTFGQSAVALRNLEEVLSDHRDLKLIVQTHVMQVRPALVEKMVLLGVSVVELGFESADTALLKAEGKLSKGLDDYETKVRSLCDAGLAVILNVMGGLDEETIASHKLTTSWLSQGAGGALLFNLYNFVPYPLIPAFPRLRGRIHDWDYAHWREDKPVVYNPQYLSPGQSWDLFQEKISVAHTSVQRMLRDIS